MPERTRIIDGKRYTYRNSLPTKIAKRVIKELRARAGSHSSFKLTDEGNDFAAIWYRVR